MSLTSVLRPCALNAFAGDIMELIVDHQNIESIRLYIPSSSGEHDIYCCVHPSNSFLHINSMDSQPLKIIARSGVGCFVHTYRTAM